jgi:hypothetical protein
MNIWKLSTVVLAGALVAVIGTSSVRTASAEPQPHMKAALAQLQAAKASLEKASADKGGHRVKAIALTNEAIEQTKKGIEFDDKH